MLTSMEWSITYEVRMEEKEDVKSPTYWQDKFNNWRSSDAPHWRWRKQVLIFLERKAKQERKDS